MPWAKGEANISAKLTAAQVRAVRQDTRIGKLVAADYGIAASQVWRIRNCMKWRHLDEEKQPRTSHGDLLVAVPSVSQSVLE
jgi:hypothetical protein